MKTLTKLWRKYRKDLVLHINLGDFQESIINGGEPNKYTDLYALLWVKGSFSSRDATRWCIFFHLFQTPDLQSWNYAASEPELQCLRSDFSQISEKQKNRGWVGRVDFWCVKPAREGHFDFWINKTERKEKGKKTHTAKQKKNNCIRCEHHNLILKNRKGQNEIS